MLLYATINSKGGDSMSMDFKVKFTSNADNVKAGMMKRIQEQFESEGFPATCPNCSHDFTFSASQDMCPSCNVGFNPS